MKLAARLAPLLLLLLLAVACSAGPKDLGYVPGADADALLAAAQVEAAKDGRRVLIVGGGDWCRWCHVLDRFLHDNPDVKAELDRNFVVVKIYAGDEGEDTAFFARLPPADGFPHFWVVHSANRFSARSTGGLENGDDDYDRDAFLRFIREAGPKGK